MKCQSDLFFPLLVVGQEKYNRLFMEKALLLAFPIPLPCELQGGRKKYFTVDYGRKIT
jgi:hypothetical protein